VFNFFNTYKNNKYINIEIYIFMYRMTTTSNSNSEGIFNEAALKMKRVDSSWQVINYLRTNMLDKNYIYDKYNYEIIISMLIGLCYEVLDMMKPTEIDQFKFYRREIIIALEEKPVFFKKTYNSLSETKYNNQINKNNWKFIMEVIFQLEDFTRLQLGIHGVSNPKKRDPSQAVIDL